MRNEIDTNTIKILVCCHKTCELPNDDIFLPIQVGSAISNVDLGIQRDDKVNGEPCDNISAKNKSYCELTAMYWAWKNIKKIYPSLLYIGINHYRRYFFDSTSVLKDLYIKPTNEVTKYKLNNKKLWKELKSGYTIISKKRHYLYPLYVDYSLCHVADDLRLLLEVIKQVSPDYVRDFNRVLMCNNKLAPYNMTIIKWDYFSSYCTWLFPILNEVERRINISNYSEKQQRIFGYMSERLFNVWLVHNNVKIKELPVIQFVDDKKELSFIYYAIGYFRSQFSMLFLKPRRTPRF